MEWRDPSTGQIKSWVWIAVGLGGLVLVFLFKGIASGQTSTGGTPIAGGQGSDITDLLSQLEDALQNMNGGNNTPPPTPTPTPTPTPDEHTWRNYRVREGDTWNSIATMFGMTLDELYAKNPQLQSLGHPDKTRAGGRTIKVFKGEGPGPTHDHPTSYVVKAGDSWKSIANKFNVSLPTFHQLNPTLDLRNRRHRQGGRTVIVGTSNVH